MIYPCLHSTSSLEGNQMLRCKREGVRAESEEKRGDGRVRWVVSTAFERRESLR